MTSSVNGRLPALLDFAGIGFGPSNLALAVAAREIDPSVRGVFFERSPAFRWHAGMLLDDATMQISFLKDLATLRNPASDFTFLQYTKARGRLERFVNLRDFHPTRVEYHDYLAWVAEAFAAQVRYSTSATRVSLSERRAGEPPSAFQIEVADERTGEWRVYHARNVVYAPGGSPRTGVQRSDPVPGVIHSSEFVPTFTDRFPDTELGYDFAVAGGGQSAGEIVAYLLKRYARARVNLVIGGTALRATDSSPYMNEHYYSHSVDDFHRLGAEQRAELRDELRVTNYGVVDPDLIDEIYRADYLDEVRGERRLRIHALSRLGEVRRHSGRLSAKIRDRFGGAERELRCDGLVLATGYDHSLDPELFEDVLPLVETDDAGEPVLSRSYRVRTTTETACGLYLQGCSEPSFGLGNTLLSQLPFRAQEIFEDIQAHRAPHRRCQRLPYPPRRHVETDDEMLYEVVERFRFATLVSAAAADDPVVTQVPLTLDRERGKKGVLFGHVDRANPHVELLDGRPVLALFHGPNAYISPHDYESDQLPTWNSITVHARGRARILRDRQALISGLCGIAKQSDRRRDGYRLRPDDPRIDRLIDQIVGFEIEVEDIVGRFKLSQDRSDADRRRAALVLARRAETSHRALIERLVDLPLGAPGDGDGRLVMDHQHTKGGVR